MFRICLLSEWLINGRAKQGTEKRAFTFQYFGVTNNLHPSSV